MRLCDIMCYIYGIFKEVGMEEHYTKVRNWVWPNFTPKEIACKGDGLIIVDCPSMDALQTLRNVIGKPLIINSGYRSIEYNRKVGGAPNSQHLKGKAFDIRITPQVSREDIKNHAKAAGFKGIGDYDSFVHVDTREKPAYWDNRT